MNILNRVQVFRSAFFRALTPKVMRFNVVPPRKAYVLTHRNELLPFTINNLWDNPGSSRTVKKIGRGLGSGKGKTAGKGYKGQRARAGGGVSHRFEGGESQFHRRMPKFGMPRKNRERPIFVNLSKVVEMIKKGRLDNSKLITIRSLYEANLFKRAHYGVKILSRGIDKVDIPINLEVSDVSKRSMDLIKAAGGSVTCVYRTKLQIREHLMPHKFPIKLENPVPSLKVVKKYEQIRERGAEVRYREPLWVKGAKEATEDFFKKKKTEEEEKPKEVKIRKRKPTIYRTIDLKLS